MSAALDRFQTEREHLLEDCTTIVDRAEAEERDPSDAELELIAANRSRIDKLDSELIPPLYELEVARSKHLERIPTVPGRQTAPDDQRRGMGEPPAVDRVYRFWHEYAYDQLLCRFPDQIGRAAGNNAVERARERLDRAAAYEATRPHGWETVNRVVANTLSADVAGLLPKDYLAGFAELIDASRPIVASAGKRPPLVRGSVTYPSITQRPTAAKQTTQKTEGSSQTMTVAFVDVTADTYMAVGDLSWQAINWSTPDALALWFQLAAEQYARQTEAAAGTVVAAATSLGNTAVNQTTGTLADWISVIMSAASAIYTAGRRRPDTIWSDVASGYILAGLVGNVSPVFFNAGQFSIRTGQGNVAGLNLVISAGLAAKKVVVGDSSALLVAETPGAPVELRAVEPSIGGMEVGVIGGFVAKLTDASGFRSIVFV